MILSVFGLGYVGTVTAACLSHYGHTVIGVDVNAQKVDALTQGTSPLIEPSLNELIGDSVASGRLTATVDFGHAVRNSDLIMVCVGTPSRDNGGLDLRYVLHVCDQIGQELAQIDDYRTIVVRSTVLPGSFDGHILPALATASGKQPGTDFGVVVNPEFLREGNAVADFEKPPFTIIGEYDSHAGSVLAALYADLDAPIHHTSPDVACMIKYASNTFHALKVAFANEIGRVCSAANVDGDQVMDIFSQDTKLNVSRKYLRPGFAFGGSCLPKDLRALLYLARHKDVSLPVIEAILPSNNCQIQTVVNWVAQAGKHRIAVLGLSFKPNTDDLRESPIVHLTEILLGKGYSVRIYDENINMKRLIGGNRAFIDQAIPHLTALMTTSLAATLDDVELVLLGHETYRGARDLLRPDQTMLDLTRMLVPLTRGMRAVI